jgi:lipopolysaccharide/colanic/teichoic acid biosynthesis glycosyltransferase
VTTTTYTLAQPVAVVDSRHRATGTTDNRAVRVLNVLVAAVGLVILAPVMAIIAMLVKLSSPGPVLYTQPRVGIDRRSGRPTAAQLARRKHDSGGRVFKIYKFRTMSADSDRAGQVWASEQDPRITRIGRILRKYRLDEVPQLWNVLRGEMNIVGPRPEQPEIFQDLRHQVAQYHQRQRVLPGITGWAQINHAYDQSIDDVRKKVEYDLEYISRRSLAQDLKIMARTIPVMVGKRGAV